MWDYVACSATLENRIIEYVDHLHEHMTHPVRMQNGRYMPPKEPGYSTEIEPASLSEYEFPAGPTWSVVR